MNLHYDESAILDYVSCDPDIPDREAIEEHLQQCAECRRTAGEVEQFIEAFGDAETWSADIPSSEPDPAKIAEFVITAEQLSEADRRAKSVAKMLLSADSRPIAPNEITPALVRTLLNESKNIREKNPKRALSIAEKANELASTLENDGTDGLAQLRGRCLKEQANAFYYLGRFQEALAALDVAESFYAETVAADYHVATVDYVRSLVYRATDRTGEALDLLRRAASVFVSYGDLLRASHARIVEGGTLFVQSRYMEAREIFRGLLESSVDAETVARTLNNIGHCDERLGEISRATESFRRAAAAFRSLGMASEEIRAEWGVARALRQAGDLDAALDRFESVEGSFASRGMLADSALAALDRVEILAERGELDAVKVISEQLVQCFTRAGMKSSAAEALSYLRATLSEGTFYPEVLQHVRLFIASLESEPDLKFQAPGS